MADSYYYSYIDEDTQKGVSPDVYRYDVAPYAGEFITCDGGMPYEVIKVNYTTQFKDYDDHGSEDYYYYDVLVKRLRFRNAKGLLMSEDEITQHIESIAPNMYANTVLVANLFHNWGQAEAKIYMDIQHGLVSLYENKGSWIIGIDLKSLIERLCTSSVEEIMCRLEHLFKFFRRINAFRSKFIDAFNIPYSTCSETYKWDGGTRRIPEGVKVINRIDFINNQEDILPLHLLSKIDATQFIKIEGLKKIVLPDSLEIIESNTFNCCHSLECVCFGKGLKKICYSAFNSCDSLKKIYLPDSLNEIGSYSFYGCSELEEVYLGENVSKIGDHAFAKCKKLTSIVIPDSVTEIGANAFVDCSLKSVIINPKANVEVNAFSSSCIIIRSAYQPQRVDVQSQQAGSGDVLTSIITGLQARGYNQAAVTDKSVGRFTDKTEKAFMEDKKWTILKSEYIIRRPWFTARRDHVRFPDGRENPEYYVLEYPDWVNVIAITKDGQFVMERQYRHALGRISYELPCGVVEQGEEPLEAITRKLLEETGYGGGEWWHLMDLSANSSTMSNMTHCFLATGVKKISEPHLDATEELEVHLLSREEVKELLNTNQFVQSLMAAPLWKYFSNET